MRPAELFYFIQLSNVRNNLFIFTANNIITVHAQQHPKKSYMVVKIALI